MFNDEYRTISKGGEAIYKDKGSKFIAKVFSVNSEEQIKEIIDNIKKEYHDASHHCYAYVLGNNKDIYRYNDDGEPSGTSGKQIYGQILSYDLTNILIIVIRYFGGTLLGVRGLINAYKNAARMAIDNSEIITLDIKEYYKLSYDYVRISIVSKYINSYSVKVLKQDYIDDKYILYIEINKNLSESFCNKLKNEGIDIENYYIS